MRGPVRCANTRRHRVLLSLIEIVFGREGRSGNSNYQDNGHRAGSSRNTVSTVSRVSNGDSLRPKHRPFEWNRRCNYTQTLTVLMQNSPPSRAERRGHRMGRGRAPCSARSAHIDGDPVYALEVSSAGNG